MRYWRLLLAALRDEPCDKCANERKRGAYHNHIQRARQTHGCSPFDDGPRVYVETRFRQAFFMLRCNNATVRATASPSYLLISNENFSGAFVQNSLRRRIAPFGRTQGNP